MSCFKLSRGLCDKLKSALIEYWWSSGNNRRKITWVAWQKLCLSKDDGGLEFHDIALFNQSLLCKQAWRLYDQPDSLVARFLKSRYYDEDHFLVAHIGSRPSYACRSILFGRELLLQGLQRSIGDGRSTNACTAKWIFDGAPRAPIRTDFPCNHPIRVVDLINRDTGTWKEELVRQLFVQQDANFILALRISMSSPDAFIWSYTKHGRYTSQSGYKFLLSSHPAYQVQTSPIEKALWSKVWKLKTAPKIRHFIWKVIHEALAVATRLQTRGIHIQSTCPMCNAGVESTAHALFTCPEAMRVWQSSGLTLPPNGFSSNSVLVNIHFLVEKLQKETSDHIEFYWVLWQIWKARNSFVFDRFKWSTQSILQRAADCALEWKTVNMCNADNADNEPPPLIQPRWSRPMLPFLKCNMACYRRSGMAYMGLSWVLRNEHGVVLLHARDSLPTVSDDLLSELQCFPWCISSMVQLRQVNIIFESSSKQAIEASMSHLRYPAYRILLQEIRDKLSILSQVRLPFVQPSSNAIAISIAKSATTGNRAHSYVQASAPSWLIAEVEQEALLP